ncbi:hypothetical protein [Pedobacter endophyticus]|uniref:Uncharacterized protein n=1 Tax=Pedobacter endophyticus TaxID=2789740 RepID=A0A7U3SPI0_9SPHI|nr:hypothetical protein [Pedobacter endophyticus]QPH38528.1 hypothetical protein IZT61_15750 [Pedobacter endophyticus]
MKKLKFTTGKAAACLGVMCLLLVQGCKKDIIQPNSKDLQNGLSIAEARAYFEQNITSIKHRKLSSTSPLADTGTADDDSTEANRPMWDAAQLKALGAGPNAVLTPLHRPNTYVNISKGRMVHYGFLNYMMMRKDEQGNMITEWVELKPTEKWIDSKTSRKYDGAIIVKNWDGSIKKIYSFDNGEIIRKSALKKRMLASLNGKVMDSSGGDVLCLVTTILTIKTQANTCPCVGHTYAQYDICDCPRGKPSEGSHKTAKVEVEYDCNIDIPDDPIDGTGGTSSGGTTIGTNGSISGAGTNGNDYVPLNCNPDPNYTIPTIPPPPGTAYVLPCSQLAIPVEPPITPITAPKTLAEILIEWFNTDADTQMHLSVAEVTFLNNNPSVTAELYEHLKTEDRAVKEFGRWAVGYLFLNKPLTFEQLLGRLMNKPFDFEPSQVLYIPRDREPASYYWRPKLKETKDFDKYLSFVPGDTKPEDLVNCYYYAFGDVPGALKYPGSPKWMLRFELGPEWEKVKNGIPIKVGDRIGYYVPNHKGNGPAWAHAGVVIEVDAQGYATKIRSKMGPYWNIIEHHPRDIPADYGSTEPSFIVNGKAEASRIYYRKK